MLARRNGGRRPRGTAYACASRAPEFDGRSQLHQTKTQTFTGSARSRRGEDPCRTEEVHANGCTQGSQGSQRKFRKPQDCLEGAKDLSRSLCVLCEPCVRQTSPG